MELTGHKKVHIVPMGFEIDRIELPLREIGADRVHLITDEQESETGLLYLEELTHRITGIISEDQLMVQKCPMWDFRFIMSQLCELVRRERQDGNFVYINLSSGSKLSAVAGTLASLMYGAVPYYVQAEKYNIEHPDIEGGNIVGITSGLHRILKIPSYTIDPPPDELIAALAVLSENGGRISQKNFIFSLEERGLLENVTQNRTGRKEVSKKGYARAKRQYFEKLMEHGWAEKMGKARSSYIQITEEGKTTYETFVRVTALGKKNSRFS